MKQLYVQATRQMLISTDFKVRSQSTKINRLQSVPASSQEFHGLGIAFNALGNSTKHSFT
jgi:hypothetical protein